MIVTDFGAVADGRTLNTDAIQAALDAAGEGGGVVTVPPGVYLTGTVFLPSNITLELLPGATLLGSPNLDDYVEMTWGARGDRVPWHLIVAQDVHNVTICGQGTIDGNGPAFWEPTVPHPDGDGTAMTVIPAREPDPARAEVMWILKPEGNRRPSPMIEIERCQDVRIHDVHITNSAGWCLHLYDSDRCWVRGICLTTNLMGPNNDGIDISGCHDVMISDCVISCCDDAICLKTFPDSRSIERVTVTNCVIRTRCAAFKTGESFGPMRQVAFTNSVVYESSRAVALYSFEGTVLEDVTISNIVCDTRSPLVMNRPIHIDLRQQGDRPLGAIRNVSISNVVVRTDGRVLLTAQPGAMLENITLRDLHLIYPTVDDPNPIGREVGGAQFSNANPDARVARGAVVAQNIHNLVIDGLDVTWPDPDQACPGEWLFALKAANGSYRLFERHEFNDDRTPDFSVVWGRNLHGGRISAPHARPSRDAVHKYDLRDCDIIHT
jgi:hypothetical protein